MAFIDNSIRSTSELTSTIKLFLHTLASYADPTGRCYPGQNTLATAMSMSVSTVRRCLKTCVELQLVTVKRKWRKSNVYKLMCIKQPKLSTMISSDEMREQPVFLRTTLTPLKPRFVDPKEVSILFDDIAEVVGPTTAVRNLRWYQKLIQHCSYDAIQSAISFVRGAIAEAQFCDKPINNPSGLMLWFLRTYEGCPI